MSRIFGKRNRVMIEDIGIRKSSKTGCVDFFAKLGKEEAILLAGGKINVRHPHSKDFSLEVDDNGIGLLYYTCSVNGLEPTLFVDSQRKMIDVINK